MELEHSTALHTSALFGPHTFRPGDICLVEEHDAKKGAIPVGERGVVFRASDTKITIALQDRSKTPEDESPSLPPVVRVIKLANDATYDRLAKTLTSLADALGMPPPPSSETAMSITATHPLFRVCMGLDVPSWTSHAPAWTPLQTRLNETQLQAISFALRAEQLALIHGPPGTGKTTTMAELIVQLAILHPNARILVCGASNLAVDNLLERVVTTPAYKEALAEAGCGVTRIGHPARVLSSLTGATLDVQCSQSDEGQLMRDVAKEIDDLMMVLSPPAGTRAGNKSARKAPRPKGAERRQMWEQVRELRKEYRRRDRALAGTVLHNTRIVMATCHGAGSRELEGRVFDYVIIDEACQALEMSCWTPLLRLAAHGKIILSGDHLQLPPTVKADAPALRSRSVSKTLPPASSLEVTLFDRLLQLYGDGCKALLSVQYRMNEEIMSYPNEALYHGKLSAHTSCAHIRLTDLGVDGDDADVFCAPLVFYDTTGLGYYEREEESLLQTHSHINENEATLVLEHMATLVSHGIEPSQVAVLSPYAAQVSLLSQQLRAKYGAEVEVGTVDGMQGREKDVVILSLVRSNDQHTVGFLQDRRRLNVAMTRAKRQLVVIGDAETIGEHGKDTSVSRVFLHNWMEHLQTEALVEVCAL